MTQITHRLDDDDDCTYRQIVTPTTLRSALDAEGSDYSRPDHFGHADEWNVGQINGHSVLIATVFAEGDYWRWRIVDDRGTEYVDGGNYRTRDHALQALNEAIAS